MVIEVFNYLNQLSSLEKKSLIDFLYQHLDNYGDPREDIEKVVDFTFIENKSFNGFILLTKDKNKIIGAVVVNHTGEGYVPENILVYIATHQDYREKGIAKELMKKTLSLTKGDITLHVEAENPAMLLYKKVGFASKYVEMRYTNPNK